MDVDALRAALAAPKSEEMAGVLKTWREREGLSQAEAAIRLGVSVRTLQGWELGRPMPYPALLQRGLNIPSRSSDPYALIQSDFPREFAKFVDFIGPESVIEVVNKIDRKFKCLSPTARSLFGDRFFFHEQLRRIPEGPYPFQLNIADLFAVRAASLIVGINRIKNTLSSRGVDRLRAMVLDNLQPDRDIRQIEHEIRCASHFGRKGFKVTFADLEGFGNFDLLVETKSGSIEVECKTVTDDTGSQLKIDLVVQLTEAFRKYFEKEAQVAGSGIFTLSFKKPTSECKHLVRKLEDALKSSRPSWTSEDFSLMFTPRPAWQALLEPERVLDFHNEIFRDPSMEASSCCAVKVANNIIALSLRPHKPSALSQRVIKIIKDGADQCTRKQAGTVWLHFSGFAEAEFRSLASFSRDQAGAGLNALVANALHPEASSTNRSHISAVCFSAAGDHLGSELAVSPTLLLTRAISSSGICYRIQNPFSQFPDDNIL